MKKLFVFIIFVAFCFAGNNAFAGFKRVKKTTQQIDSVYKEAPFIINSLKKKKQTIYYGQGGEVHLFTGVTPTNKTVHICKFEAPSIMRSEAASMQIIVDGRQFICPLKLSGQSYDNPKFINGMVVIRVHYEGYHFYVIAEESGHIYDTEF